MKFLGVLLMTSAFVFGASKSSTAVEEKDWVKTEDQALVYFQEYLRFDTTNPPGDTSKAAAYLKDLLDREGIETELFPADPVQGKVNLLARLKGSGKAKPLLLLNHIDVVPVDRGKWLVDPFGGEIQGNVLWGRGTLDMKGIGMAELVSLVTLKRKGIPLKRDVIFLAVCDEEIGGRMGAEWMTKNHYDLLDPEFVLDEGGFISQGLLTAGDQVIISPAVSEKKVLWLKLIAEGEAGHGSMPHEKNPNDRLVRAIQRVLDTTLTPEESPIVGEMESKLGSLEDNRFTRAIRKNTISVTSLRSGVGEPPKVNVIPSQAEATLDIRLLPETDTQKFLELFKGLIADDSIRIEVTHLPPDVASSPIDTELYSTIGKVAKKFYPEAVMAPLLLPGGTDSRFFREKGAVAYGFSPFLVEAGDLALIHGDNERISVERFKKGVRILYELVKELAAD